MGLSLARIRRSMTRSSLCRARAVRHLKLKHYSSGMSSRLAYAVAFRAVREVLVLDEIFAVGDAGFRAGARSATSSPCAGAHRSSRQPRPANHSHILQAGAAARARAHRGRRQRRRGGRSLLVDLHRPRAGSGAGGRAPAMTATSSTNGPLAVAVIITCYDLRCSLDEAWPACARRHFRDYALTVVDDGSRNLGITHTFSALRLLGKRGRRARADAARATRADDGRGVRGHGASFEEADPPRLWRAAGHQQDPSPQEAWRLHRQAPLLIRLPGSAAAGDPEYRSGGQLDIAPTLLSLLRIDATSGPGWAGTSPAPACR